MPDIPMGAGPVSKKYNWKDTRKNSRSHNTAAGAAVGAAELGAFGAAVGGVRGAKTARGGLRDLKLMGAHPGKVRAGKLVARGAAVKGGKGAVAMGTLGAVGGTIAGVTSRSKPRRRVGVAKSAFGVEHEVSKAYPLGTEAAATARKVRIAHDAGKHIKVVADCPQCTRDKAVGRK